MTVTGEVLKKLFVEPVIINLLRERNVNLVTDLPGCNSRRIKKTDKEIELTCPSGKDCTHPTCSLKNGRDVIISLAEIGERSGFPIVFAD